MPVARGIMQIGRINVFPTTTTLVSINPPDVGFCGNTITFTVTVSNDSDFDFSVPTGTVLIKDNITNTTLASGSLSGGTAIINASLTISNNEIYAQYVGVVNHFGASQSSPTVPYSVSIVSTTTTITNTPGTYFCFHNNFTLSAHVAPNSGLSFPSGIVQFNLYTDPFTFTTIGIAALDVSGNAIITLPANTTTPGNNYYIQAKYLGNGCFGSSNSPIGTSGTLIHSVSLTQNSTNITSGVSGGTTFCINAVQTFTATVGSTLLGGPSVGSVTWVAEKLPSVILLGTDLSVVAGAASINVPGGTFTSGGTWTIFAAYTGDGYCFGNCTAPSILVHPTTFSVNMSISVGSEIFCYGVPQTFQYNVSSSLPGTISGTFTLKSSLGYTITSVTTSGSASGFVLTINIPAYSTADGTQDLFVEFTPVSNSCYSFSTSGNFTTSIKSFVSQTPDHTTLDVSPASGTVFTTFNFTITVFKGSGIGPVDGAGFLNGSGTIFIDDFNIGIFTLNNNVHIFDYGTYGSGSYSASGLAISTISAIGRWNGNACYSFQDSPAVPITVSPIIH